MLYFTIPGKTNFDFKQAKTFYGECSIDSTFVFLNGKGDEVFEFEELKQQKMFRKYN